MPEACGQGWLFGVCRARICEFLGRGVFARLPEELKWFACGDAEEELVRIGGCKQHQAKLATERGDLPECRCRWREINDRSRSSIPC